MKYLRARRGQAFETMMLVISVIVALAILAVLLNILGIVKIFNPSSPKDVMASGLKEIQSKGYGITTPQKVSFTKGATITVGELISDIPIQAANVKFICKKSGTNSVCGDVSAAVDKPIIRPAGAFTLATDSAAINANHLTIKDTIQVYVAICGNEDNPPTAYKYCIAVSDTPDGATADCVAASTNDEKGGCGIS